MLRSLSPLSRRVLFLVVLVVLIGVTFQSQTDVYLSQRNFMGMLRAMSVSGIVAIGLTFVIIIRKFDLSLAGIASLAAMTLGFAVASTNSLYAGIASGVVIGLVFGCINGLLVGRFRLPDVVTTIAIGSIAYGCAFVYNGGGDFSRNFMSSGLVMMSFNTFLGIQIPIFIFLMVACLAMYLVHATRVGAALYATGENLLATYLSGVSTNRATMLAFAVCGALVGLAMALQVSGIGSSRVTAGGQIMLPAYSAVYLGAALLGRASVFATLAGVLIMTMLLNGFTLLQVPYYFSDAVVSLVLILAITVFDPRILARLSQSLSVFRRRGTS